MAAVTMVENQWIDNSYLLKKKENTNKRDVRFPYRIESLPGFSKVGEYSQ
ncbi:MAG: hypothetical protein ACI93N_002161 [Flavobacteriaceae bacterium]|jgi:hypothetical protein